ncbi:deformed epidermal autoregulatory factor 1 homolog [Scomber scombrus]|uniref:Deformed epidermal autoregulatory factor 1 homolog n=1 Tax=Scomber scombrus TaxID=13677 RepID=A0AAV1QL86_SCOSC
MAVATAPSVGLVGGLEMSPVGGMGPVGGDGQKNTWLYLEELANTLMSNVQQLKALIDQAKHTEGGQGAKSDDSDSKRSSDITELIINQMCVNCGRVAMSECTGCHKVNYCSTFCQRKDWKDHQHTCCQSGGGVSVQEEEPITGLDMDKVK